MKEIKFRAWITVSQKIASWEMIKEKKNLHRLIENPEYLLMQYTGLKDKNGVDIYEYMELDNQFEVSFSHGSYILTNISNGDIMTLHKYIKDKNGQVKITKEYTKI